MTATRILVLAAALALCGGPVSSGVLVLARPVPALSPEPVDVVCGPARCVQRPFWRYGAGRGFAPFAPPNARPFRRFGYSPFALGGRGFGFRRR